jgi:SsrA-binding protein
VSSVLTSNRKAAPEQTVATNRKAYHDFAFLETMEVGIALLGTEMKSIRAGRVSLRDAYARIESGEVWLVGAHIAGYAPAGPFNHEPTRRRKLLLHRDEIRDLASQMVQKGLTLVPLRMYIRDGLVKVELGLARGKRQYDKRQTIAKRSADREAERAIKLRPSK